MNPLNPYNDPYAKKIQQEYAFEDTHKMSNFVHKITRNPGVTSVDLRGKKAISVSFMNQDAMATTDAIYNESYQPVEEKGSWWDQEEKKYDAKYGPGKKGDDTSANRAARKKKLDKIASDEREVKARKQREIERGREAESKRKGDEAKKRKSEADRKRKEQEKKLTDDVDRSWTWSQNPLPDVTAALEEVLKRGNMVESTEVSEMDPKKHVKKNEETGMYCVYNKDGKKVKEFKSQEDANQYATDNHDSLMEYGSPMKPGKKPRTANEPLVKTGQGSYEKNIRPSDILKKKKKR